MKASGGRGSVKSGGCLHFLCKPRDSQLHPTVCYLETSLLLRFTSVYPSLLD